MRSALVGWAALAAAISMWSCNSSSSTYSGTPTAPTDSSASAIPAGAVTVDIVGSSGSGAFRPNPVAVNPGQTLAFRNNDLTMHHIVMDDGSVDFGDVVPGASRSATINNTGGNYHCTIHPTMVGSVNGTTAPAPPDCNPPGSCDGY